jgi:hypothetical protein
MQDNLDKLIAIVSKIGVTTCDNICGPLNNTNAIATCESLCVTVGSEQFWHMFVSAGINPIYACEIVTACVANPFPAATITNYTVSPSSGPIGTIFEFKAQFTALNETGVGQTAFVFYYPQHAVGLITETLFANYVPGNYEITYAFPTNASTPIGSYTVEFDVCSGGCGLQPAPDPYAISEVNFSITGG